MYFRKYALSKTWLDKYQKRSASEYPWTTDQNTAQICTAACLPCLVITLKDTEFDKVSLSDMQNFKTFSFTHSLPMTSILFLIETI